MAGKHVAVWPKVRVTVDGKSKIIERGELVPTGVSAVDLDNLVTFGAIAGVTGLPETAATDGGDGKSDSVKSILAEVGDDKAKAQAALDVESAKDEPRKTLVDKLQAIVEG